MSKHSSISVIFPAYNEEANIDQSVSSALQVLPMYFDQWEIIIVNDGSHDDTASIIDQLEQQHPSVRTIHHPDNHGYGAALRSGITSATNDFIFFCDSDLQFDLREIRDLLLWIDQYDIVIGYRAVRRDHFYRRVNAWGWNQLVRLILGLKIRDIDCAFKLFRSTVFKKVKIDAVGAMVNTDILAQAEQHHFVIKEVPVSHYPRLHGTQTGANLKVIFKAFKELIQLYQKLHPDGRQSEESELSHQRENV